MNVLRVTAGAVSLVDSVIALYLSEAMTFSGTSLISQSVMLWAGGFLLVDSLLCIYGVHYAFPVGAVLSAALAAGAFLTGWGLSMQEVLPLGLSLVAVALNVLAFRSTSKLSEQANPMNLPVFG